MNGVAMWTLLACTAPSGDGEDTSAPVDDTGRDTDTEVIDDTGPDDTDTDTGETDTGPDDELAYEAFFDPLEVQRIDLELTDEAIAALREEPEEYVEGVFVHDGYRHESIGVRLKGGSSTFDTIDGKPSFKLKLDEYDDGQDYGGLDRINLHNMKADAAQAREVVAYAVWAAAGFAAPRANYAEVYVNGVSYGVYANVEEVDDAFLERRYEDAAGDLWEAADEADLTPGGVDNFQLVSGEGDTDALDYARYQVQTGEGAFYDVADGVLDMSQFLDFWAWQIATGNEDGYPYELDDYSIYADPAKGGRYVWQPWGLDETWNTEAEWDDYTGTVAVHCAYDDACEALLRERVAAALTTYESLDVDAIAQAALTVSESAVQVDTRREASLSDVMAARSQLLTIVAGRPAAVRGQMGM